jgi:hypothetical protein
MREHNENCYFLALVKLDARLCRSEKPFSDALEASGGEAIS